MDLRNGSAVITCRCQSFDLFLSWKAATGMFDLLHYLVNISEIGILEVNTTSLTISVLPDTDYLVLISTVSECQQQSRAAMILQSAEGIVRAGKEYFYIPSTVV